MEDSYDGPAVAETMHTDPAPSVPDYLASPNAVLGDVEAQWRYGRPPDYSKTRKVWEESMLVSKSASASD